MKKLFLISALSVSTLFILKSADRDFDLGPSAYAAEPMCCLGLGGNRVAIGSTDGTILEVDFDSPSRRKFSYGDGEPVTSLLSLANGTLLSAGENNLVVAWSKDRKQKKAKRFSNHIQVLQPVGKNRIAVGLWHGGIRIVAGRKLEREIAFNAIFSGAVESILPLNENILIAGETGGDLAILNLSGRVFKKLPKQHTGAVCSLIKLSDNKFVSADWDGDIIIWEINSDNRINSRTILPYGSKGVLCLVDLKNGTFASGDEDGQIRVWNAKTGVLLKMFGERGSAGVRCLTLLDSGVLLSVDRAGALARWSVSNYTIEDDNSGYFSEENEDDDL